MGKTSLSQLHVTPKYPNTSNLSHQQNQTMPLTTKQQSKHTTKMHSAGENTNLGAAGEKTLIDKQERDDEKREKKKKMLENAEFVDWNILQALHARSDVKMKDSSILSGPFELRRG